MFERFTEAARRVVLLAQEEARRLNHEYVGTEHLLLGLIGEGEGAAARALASLGVSQQAARQQVEESTGRGEQPTRPGHIPFTAQATRALQWSLRETMRLGAGSIGPEHLLLGLLRERDSLGVQVLARLGADVIAARQRVTEVLERDREPELPAAGRRAAGRGRRALVPQLLARFDAIESRLSALEERVGTGPDLHQLDQELARVRRDKQAAVDVQDFEHAAALRDREHHLLAQKAARQQEWSAAHSGLPSLSDEVVRLRDLLRQHGIDPQNGAA